MVQTQRNNEEALLAMGHWEDLYLQIFSGDTDPILYYVNHTLVSQLTKTGTCQNRFRDFPFSTEWCYYTAGDHWAL